MMMVHELANYGVFIAICIKQLTSTVTFLKTKPAQHAA
jgi:hypothetical protein